MLFSGITVAVSLAALIALPVPFLRSVGFTGLLIPLISVLAALTLLPALLLTVGPRLAWPNRRRATRRAGCGADRRLGRAPPLDGGRRLAARAAGAGRPRARSAAGAPSNDSLASTGGSAATAITQVERSGLGAGLTQPIEILTTDPAGRVGGRTASTASPAAIAPPAWRRGGTSIVDVWTVADASSGAGTARPQVRRPPRTTGARVGGIPAQNADFITAVYGNAWWIGLIIIAVTFLLLARALRSIVLPIKALCSTSSRSARPTASPC